MRISPDTPWGIRLFSFEIDNLSEILPMEANRLLCNLSRKCPAAFL